MAVEVCAGLTELRDEVLLSLYQAAIADLTELKVIDRTMLILDIFAQHADHQQAIDRRHEDLAGLGLAGAADVDAREQAQLHRLLGGPAISAGRRLRRAIVLGLATMEHTIDVMRSYGEYYVPMTRPARTLFPNTQRQAEALGERLKAARLRIVEALRHV